tara:strand:+ start:546 stop:1118 length:573 start_codon:yes stop_codon:yes gene_type:complete
MRMNEGGWWMVFTAVCLASLVVVLEVEGIINLYEGSDSNSNDDDQTENIPTDVPLESTADEVHPFGEACLTTHDVAMHFHPYLTIVIDDVEFEIPDGTGIDTEICPGAMHMTHTHDASGKIHVEGHSVEEVPLEVFFDVWGMHFNESGIMDYRNGTIEMTVDGQPNSEFQNLILADNQNIVITYTSNQGE